MTKVIILSTQRSGTRLLGSCLRSHPDTSCEDRLEVLLDWSRGQKVDPIRVLHDFFAKDSQQVRMCVVMHNHLNKSIIGWLKTNGVKIIHLVREGYVHRAVSHYIVNNKNKVGRAGPHPLGKKWGPVRIKVDVPWVVSQIIIAKANTDRFRSEFEDGPYLEITYKDLVGYEGSEVSELPGDATKELLQFLGLDFHPLTTKMHKYTPGPLNETVINYDELMQAVKRI